MNTKINLTRLSALKMCLSVFMSLCCVHARVYTVPSLSTKFKVWTNAHARYMGGANYCVAWYMVDSN